jgi:hypothetical protein
LSPALTSRMGIAGCAALINHSRNSPSLPANSRCLGEVFKSYLTFTKCQSTKKQFTNISSKTFQLDVSGFSDAQCCWLLWNTFFKDVSQIPSLCFFQKRDNFFFFLRGIHWSLYIYKNFDFISILDPRSLDKWKRSFFM